MVKLIAIDPGAISGAIATFSLKGSPLVGDLPVVDGQVDGAALSRFLALVAPEVVVVERVGSMPAQGVASTFKFGMAVGIIHGCVLGRAIPLHLVTPSRWKRYFNLGKDKEAARALAIRLYPAVTGIERKKDHGRAEALLMGHWFLNNKE